VKPWVLDASALAGVLLDPPRYSAVLDLLEDDGADVVVPHLADVEVLSALRRVVRRGEADADRAGRALECHLELPLRRFEHTPVLDRAFALRDNFSAYDAVYVALAEALCAPLVTADARLGRAVRAWTEVEVLEVG
jgi:predicted nucleic acid-binding protein